MSVPNEPKALFNQLTNDDTFDHVLVVGIAKDGTVQWRCTNMNLLFVSLAAGQAQRVLMDALAPGKSAPMSQKIDVVIN